LQTHVPFEKCITHIAITSLNSGEGVKEPGNTRKRLGQFTCAYIVRVEETIKRVNLELNNPVSLRDNPIKYANAVNYIRVLPEHRKSLKKIQDQNFWGF
jgi:hypothetical protein